MRQFVTKKKIIIPYNGRIRLKGNIMGPIEIPYMEDIKMICKLIMDKYPVYEVLKDGSKVKLTLINYNEDLNPETTSMTKEYKQVSVKESKELIKPKAKNSVTPQIVLGTKTGGTKKTGARITVANTNLNNKKSTKQQRRRRHVRADKYEEI